MMKAPKRHYIKAIVDRISHPAVAFYTLPLIMLLLIAGTVAQRFMGIYDAHQTFFAVFIAWAGPVPLPGGYSLLTVIALSLLARFLFKSEWAWEKAGLHLAHLGVLLLLFGGLLTALTMREGFLVLPEGREVAHVLDYHDRSLVLLQDDEVIGAIPHDKIKSGAELDFPGLPFRLSVKHRCRNCAIIAREETPRASALPLKGMARFMALASSPPEKENEVNLYGAMLEITGAEEDENGAYIIFEGMPAPITVSHNGRRFDLLFGKSQRGLPFTLELTEFEKESYPGLDKARGYRSDLLVHDGPVSWPAQITMNKPLRYKGYAFFQSSFIGPDGAESSVLNVVWNRGWLFPYIGTLMIAAGLLMHLFLRLQVRRTP